MSLSLSVSLVRFYESPFLWRFHSFCFHVMKLNVESISSLSSHISCKSLLRRGLNGFQQITARQHITSPTYDYCKQLLEASSKFYLADEEHRSFGGANMNMNIYSLSYETDNIE